MIAEHPDRPSRTRPHVGRVLNERYRLLGSIGIGASAEVFLADDLLLGRQVAVKILHPALSTTDSFRRRFQAEARAAASLNHPNVLAVYDWSDESEVMLVTELLAGGSLRQILDAGSLSPSQALLIGLDAANGLAHAHAAGFVHRDIKPANLMFRRDGRLAVADFGIARAVAEAAWTEPEGALIGTARYAAPEQGVASGVDSKADVYSLALTLIEAVTGDVPLLADNALATMLLRQDADVSIEPESAAAAALGPLAQALVPAAKAEPNARPSAAELATSLQQTARLLPRPDPISLAGISASNEGVTVSAVSGQAPAPAADQAVRRPASGSGESDAQAEADVTRPIVSGRDATTPMPSPLLPSEVSAPDGVDASEVTSPDPTKSTDVAPGHAADVGSEPNVTPAIAAQEAEQSSRARGPLLVMLGLLCLAAGGLLAGFWFLSPDDDAAEVATTVSLPTLPVGTYEGKFVDDVRRDIEVSGWSLRPTMVREDGTVAGQILTQSPPPGFQLTDGGVILLVISEGPRLHATPELIGLSFDEAEAAMEANGLVVGEIERRFDEEAVDGVVLEQSVDVGVDLETGDGIDLVISAGPEPRILPVLAGRTPVEAEAALTVLGLVTEIVEEFSQDVPEGIVIASTPTAEALVERGATVTIVVSKGLPFVTVPDVRGMAAAEAADVLTAAGLVVADTEGPPNREVLATDPPAGESRRQGTQVIIFTRR